MSSDGLSRIGAYFPTRAIASFWVVANLIINGQLVCDNQSRQLVIAIMVLFCLLVIISSFTDTYIASNNQAYIVILLPLYGPVCFSLPSDYDKDRVYEFFYLKTRDYVHAFISMATFLLIVIFINPIAICLFPAPAGDPNNNGSKLSTSIIRTVPVLISVIMGLAMLCIGPPRQMIGHTNVEETCPREKGIEEQMGANPMFGPPPPPPMGPPPPMPMNYSSQRQPSPYLQQPQYGGPQQYGGPPPPMGPQYGGPPQMGQSPVDGDDYEDYPPPAPPLPAARLSTSPPVNGRNPSVAQSTGGMSSVSQRY